MPPAWRSRCFHRPGEARQHVLELRQLHLEPCFARARAPREDVEDQLGAVHHLDPELLLEIPHLRGGEVVVEDRDVGIVLLGGGLELCELALPDEGRGVDRAAPLHHAVEHASAGGCRAEVLQLLERALQVGAVARAVPDQHRALSARRVRDLVHPLQAVSISRS
jgi:hypothetical protein